MNIHLKQNNPVTLFSDLSGGGILFRTESGLVFMTLAKEGRSESINAIRMNDGTLAFFFNTTEVIKLEYAPLEAWDSTNQSRFKVKGT